MKKKVLIIAAGVALVLIVFIWQVVANLDSIVAGVIEDVGSDVVKTRVSVMGVSINLKEGKAGIDGLTIANPDGYSNANIFAMNGIEVDLDLKSLGDDVLVIESIRIRNPKIVFEGNDTGGSNMQTLLDNIESDQVGSDAGGRSGNMKIIIEELDFSGGQVRASSALKPGKAVNLQLPSIRMSGIGRSQGGVTADVIMQQVSRKLANQVIEAAVKAEIEKVLEKKKKEFQDLLGEVIKGSQ